MPGHLKDGKLIPNYLTSKSKHWIQDSGLFTLMFGSQQGKVTTKLIYDWYEGLKEFTLSNNKNITIVEIDCQRVLNSKIAWELRKRMRDEIPNRKINVFHKEDGQRGLDELIEFSDYIAISVPELRVLKQKEDTIKIANYIKNKKPEIDIHLLGCTEIKLLNRLRFCTSSDSTTYTSGKRYGYIKGTHINNINTDKVKGLISDEGYRRVREYNNERNANAIMLNIYHLMNQYNKYAGPQD